MTLRAITTAMLLLATMVSLCVAQGLYDPNTEYRFRPSGELVQEINGSHSYIVGEDDYCGQWQVAFGNANLWSILVQANSTKLENPNLIKAGDRLNVPDELVPLFRFVYGSDHLPALSPDTVRKVDTVEVKNDEEKWTESWFFWVMVIAIAIFLWLLASSIARQQAREKYEKQKNEEELKRSNQEAARRLSDPYSGPDQVKGGLPTAESAIQHFANGYHQERSALTVADSNKRPDRVRIVSMKAVDVRGPMEICYAGSKEPETKDIKDWTPAWQCFLDDGSWCISLMRCGNDVWFEGKRMKPLSEDQIRDRQEGTIQVNRQIWPTIDSGDQPTTTEETVKDDEDSAPQTPIYRKVVIESPTRWLLHKHDGGNPAEINVALLGDMVKLSFIGNQVIAETKGDKQVIGEIVERLTEEETPEEPAKTSDDSPETPEEETSPTGDNSDKNDNLAE